MTKHVWIDTRMTCGVTVWILDSIEVHQLLLTRFFPRTIPKRLNSHSWNLELCYSEKRILKIKFCSWLRLFTEITHIPYFGNQLTILSVGFLWKVLYEWVISIENLNEKHFSFSPGWDDRQDVFYLEANHSLFYSLECAIVITPQTNDFLEVLYKCRRFFQIFQRIP